MEVNSHGPAHVQHKLSHEENPQRPLPGTDRYEGCVLEILDVVKADEDHDCHWAQKDEEQRMVDHSLEELTANKDWRHISNGSILLHFCLLELLHEGNAQNFGKLTHAF